MGHTACEAVKAVVGGANVGPNIAKLVDSIAPAAQQVKTSLPGLSGDALVQAVVDANVIRAIHDLLKNSEKVRHLASAGKIKVVGAVYDLHHGTVRWLGEHPQQSQFLGDQSPEWHDFIRFSDAAGGGLQSR
jgi:carbonic anhydrase